jgi:hypothetical protein
MILRKLDANRAAEMVEEKGAIMDRELAALLNSLYLRCNNEFFGRLFLVNSNPVV